MSSLCMCERPEVRELVVRLLREDKTAKESGAGEHISQQPHAASPEGETKRDCTNCQTGIDGECDGEVCNGQWRPRLASA